jgi:hypothetical protein
VAFTVTATQSVNTGPGMLLQVYALDFAALAGTPATGTSTTAYSCSVTTTTAGSMVLGAICNLNNNGAFTATANSTLAQYGNVAHGCQYAAFFSSLTGTPGAAAYGATDGFSTYYGACGVEVLASGGTLAIDAASPASVGSDTATALTTASFTPGASATLLAAIVSGTNGPTGGPVTMTFTDTSGFGLAWTTRVSVTSAVAATFAWIGVATALLPSGTSTTAGLASGAGAALNATTLPAQSLAGPAYATTATDLGGVYGSWGTPQFATGGP